MSNNQTTSTPNETQNSTSAPGKTETVKDYVSRSELEETLTRVRNQERDKLREKLEAAQNSAKTAEDQKAALAAEIESIKAAIKNKVDLPKEEAPDLTDNKVMANQFKQLQEQLAQAEMQRKEELKLLRQQLADQKKALVETEKRAQSLVQKAELERFKADLIKQKKVKFAKFISGGTKEEIIASVEAQLLEEEELRKEAREEWAKDNKANAPGPLSPNSKETLSFKTQLEHAKKTPQDFQKWKKAELAAARKKG